jgi:hypothetical protein
MSNAKHTPGPWQAVHEGHRLSVWAEGYGFIHTYEVPEVNVGATETANANSHLIAASPELLAALKQIEDFMPRLPPALVDRIITAIDKAEGR